MVNGSCVPNKQCTNREFFSNGNCVQVPLACLTFLGDGTCTSCASGNVLLSGVCTPAVPAVRAWNDCTFPCSTCFFGELTYCFSCRFGYQLRNAQYGTCVPIVVWFASHYFIYLMYTFQHIIEQCVANHNQNMLYLSKYTLNHPHPLYMDI